jgi:hypothetical protein
VAVGVGLVAVALGVLVPAALALALGAGVGAGAEPEQPEPATAAAQRAPNRAVERRALAIWACRVARRRSCPGLMHLHHGACTVW